MKLVTDFLFVVGSPVALGAFTAIKEIANTPKEAFTISAKGRLYPDVFNSLSLADIELVADIAYKSNVEMPLPLAVGGTLSLFYLYRRIKHQY